MKVGAGLGFLALLGTTADAFDYFIAYPGDISLIDGKTGIVGAYLTC